MKLNLCLFPKGNLNDYVNICATAQPHDKNFVYGDIAELNDFVDDGEAEEIVAMDILPYFPPKEADELLRRWVAKLKLGGTIVLGAFDCNIIGRLLNFRSYTHADFQRIILGENGERHSLHSLEDTTKKLIARNMKITSKKIENNFFVIKAERQ